MGVFLVLFSIGFYVSHDVSFFFDQELLKKPMPSLFIKTRGVVAVLAVLGSLLLMFGV